MKLKENGYKQTGSFVYVLQPCIPRIKIIHVTFIYSLTDCMKVLYLSLTNKMPVFKERGMAYEKYKFWHDWILY
jgi:hypothetical protein